MDVDGPLQGIALYRPIESVEQDLTGQDPAFSLHQCREQAELSCSQGNNSVVTSQLEPVEVDREVAVLNRAAILRPSRRALSPAEDGLDSHDELGGGEGLDQVIVGAFMDAVDTVGSRAPRGEDHDWDLRTLANDPQQGQ